MRWKADLVIMMHGINDLYRSCSPERYAVGDYDPSWSHFYGPAILGAKPPTFWQYIWLYRGPALIELWYGRPKYRAVDYPVSRFRSLEQFENNLTNLVHYVRSDGAVPVLLTQPSLYKDDNTPDEVAHMLFGRRFCVARVGAFTYEYPTSRSLHAAMRAFNDVTRRVAKDQHVPLMDVASQIPRTLELFADDVHYTPQGAAARGGGGWRCGHPDESH